MKVEVASAAAGAPLMDAGFFSPRLIMELFNLVSLIILSLNFAEGELVTGGLKRVKVLKVTGFVKESVELPAQSCPGLNTLRALRDGGSLVLGHRVNGAWIPEDGFRERTEFSPAGVFLKDLTYNDNGLYDFTCGEDVSVIRLDVVILSYLSVTEGLTARLPCYCQTLGEDGDSVKWFKHKQLVLKLQLPGGQVHYGEGFKGRVSVADWASGDVSLMMERVQLKDRGDYFCSVPKTRGTPAAVRLTVLQRSTTPSNVTGSTPPAPPDQHNPWMTAFWVMLLISAGIFTLLGWILRGIKLCSSSPGTNTGTNEDVLLKENSPAQTNGGC